MALEKSQQQLAQRENRNLVSTIIVGALVGLSFSQMAGPLGQDLRNGSIDAGTIFLATAFFTVQVRFVLGNQLHLVKQEWTDASAGHWYFDFCVVLIQSLLLAFMASLCSIKQSNASTVDFVGPYFWLLILDLIWFAIAWFRAKIDESLREVRLEKAWAVINLCVLACMLVPAAAYGFKLTSTYGFKCAIYYTNPYFATWGILVAFAAFLADRNKDIIQRLISREDQDFLNLAIKLAEEARSSGMLPDAAMLVHKGRIISSARFDSGMIRSFSPEFHCVARCLAPLDNKPAAPKATLYLTSVPCPVCIGLITRAEVSRIVIGQSKIPNNNTSRTMLSDGQSRRHFEVYYHEDPSCLDLLQQYRRTHPEIDLSLI